MIDYDYKCEECSYKSNEESDFMGSTPEETICNDCANKKKKKNKTLKDLKIYYSDSKINIGMSEECVSLHELKEEVIKWIKIDLELLLHDDERGMQEKIMKDIFINRWIKRFNITEEDLK